MKRTIATHLAILLIGMAIGYEIAKRYRVAFPDAVTLAIINNYSSFGISKTNAPLEQILSLVWQAVENPHRKTWTVHSRSWIEPVGPTYFPETNSISRFYSITETNEMTQPENGEYCR